MIKIYCDRCKVEIKKNIWKGIGQENLEKNEINNDKWHLCPDCYNSFIDWKNELRASGAHKK